MSQQILFWLFGSLAKATWPTLWLTAAVTAICGLVLLGDSWKLAALRMGEARAASLGVDVRRLRMKTLVLVALMTATATSFVGVIGFVGLVAPHIARLISGEDLRFLLPMSMLFVPESSGHYVQSYVVRDGAGAWKSKADETYTVKLDAEGIYLYVCPPHLMMSMIGVVQVGRAGNIEAVREKAAKLPPKRVMKGERLDAYLGLVSAVAR